jgi:branched-chain amino acid transport system ATP-binding protein
MGDQRVIDAYLGSHHDQDLSPDMEEEILAAAQAEIDKGHGQPPATATEGEHRG